MDDTHGVLPDDCLAGCHWEGNVVVHREKCPRHCPACGHGHEEHGQARGRGNQRCFADGCDCWGFRKLERFTEHIEITPDPSHIHSPGAAGGGPSGQRHELRDGVSMIYHWAPDWYAMELDGVVVAYVKRETLEAFKGWANV